jgi:hypothetical protein
MFRQSFPFPFGITDIKPITTAIKSIPSAYHIFPYITQEEGSKTVGGCRVEYQGPWAKIATRILNDN